MNVLASECDKCEELEGFMRTLAETKFIPDCLIGRLQFHTNFPVVVVERFLPYNLLKVFNVWINYLAFSNTQFTLKKNSLL